MIINCNDEEMILMGDGFNVSLDKTSVKEIKERYEEYFGTIGDDTDKSFLHKMVINIVEKYIEKHPLGVVIGEEYVGQNDEAQQDAISMFSDIMDLYAEYNGEEE